MKNKRYVIILSVLLIALMFITQAVSSISINKSNETKITKNNGEINFFGYVYDDETGETIQGAEVAAYTSLLMTNKLDSDVTDSNGYYDITVPGVGTRWLAVKADDYRTYVGKSTLQIYSGTFPQQVDFYLKETDSINRPINNIFLRFLIFRQLSNIQQLK